MLPLYSYEREDTSTILLSYSVTYMSYVGLPTGDYLWVMYGNSKHRQFTRLLEVESLTTTLLITVLNPLLELCHNPYVVWEWYPIGNYIHSHWHKPFQGQVEGLESRRVRGGASTRGRWDRWQTGGWEVRTGKRGTDRERTQSHRGRITSPVFRFQKRHLWWTQILGVTVGQGEGEW